MPDPTPSAAAHPQPVLIDTDPGIDDMLALFLALASPELDVRGISVSYGNTTVENAYRNANGATLKITEYFTRIDAETIEYKFTVDDPNTWTKPWTAIVPLSSVPGPLWEYACSESNNDAIQIMVGARNAEKAEAEKPKTPAGIPISQSQSK